MSVLLRLLMRGEPSTVELAQSVLWGAGSTGIFEPSEGELVAGFVDYEQAVAARESLQKVEDGFGWEISIDRESQPTWQSHVATSEVTVDAPDGQRTLAITSNQAFGHGGHPTTQIALELLGRFVKPGDHVLDVGTGTGVLALAAAALGAAVVAVDIDPAAVETAQANAAVNDLSIDCSTKSLARVAAENEGGFDFVVANMLLVVHRELHRDIAQLVGSKGRLVVTGTLASQLAEVRSLYGQTIDLELRRDDWVAASWTNGLNQ